MHIGSFATDATTIATVGLAVANAALLTLLLIRRQLVYETVGKILFLMGALVFPGLVIYATANVNLENAKKVSFCNSCHEMGPYVQSLEVDDDEMVPAVHHHNNLVKKEEAC